MSTSVKLSKAAAIERRHDALKLRIAGKTYEEIGNEFGIHKTWAYTIIKQALEELATETRESAQELRELEKSRLDALWDKAFTLLNESTVTVSHGKVIYLVDPDTGERVALKDNAPVLAAIDRCVRISERRSKLLGLDAPQQIETSGTIRYEIVGVNPADLGGSTMPSEREYVEAEELRALDGADEEAVEAEIVDAH